MLMPHQRTSHLDHSPCAARAWQTLGALNLTGFVGDKYADGIMVKEVHERLKLTPYELYGWTRVAGAKRTRDGTQRRAGIFIFELINLVDAIVVAEARVQTPGGGPTAGHAVVWDGWRSLLFIGPGAYDDRALDGTLRIAREDQVRSHSNTARPSSPLSTAPHRSSPLIAAPAALHRSRRSPRLSTARGRRTQIAWTRRTTPRSRSTCRRSWESS